MRNLALPIFLVLFLLNSGCDTNQASFEDTIPLNTLTTNVSPEEGGTIQPGGGEFSAGDGIEIEAQPADGYVFERWEGDLSGNTNPEFLLFNGNKSVTAHFSVRDYNLNIEIIGEGSVREAIEERPADQNESDSVDTSVKTVQLTAEADDGWFFDRWEGDLMGSSNPETITVDEEKNVTAIFEQENTDGYTIQINIEGEGSVEKNPDRDFFNEGDEVVLTANADTGWRFIEWQGDVSGNSNSQTVVMNEDKVVTAVFESHEDPYMEIVRQPSATRAGSPISPSPEIQLIDSQGEPISGAEINVTLNKNSFNPGSSTTAVTNQDGIASFSELTIETASSGYILTFETDASNVSDISSTSFEVFPDEADPSASSADVSNGTTGEETEITISVQDRFGNAITGIGGDISVEISGANNITPSVTETSTIGQYSANYIPVSAGSDQVSIEIDETPIPGSPFSSSVAPADASPSNSSVTVNPSAVQVGENSKVTVKLRDDNGNPIGGISSSDFNVNVAGNATAGSPTETSTAGTYEFDVTSKTLGEVTLSISVNGTSLSDTPVITFEAGDPHEIVIVTQPLNTRSGQPINGPPSVRVRDEFGHNISGVDVEVREQGGQEFSSGTVVITTDDSGLAEFDDLVIHASIGWFNLVFSTDGVDEIVSDRFRVSFLERGN